MTDSGFSRPELPELISTIRSDLLTRFNDDVVLRRLDAEVYGRTMAAAVHTLYGYLDYLAKNLLPDLADENWLVRHGNLKQVPRKSATAAWGFVRWEGVGNITLPAGTLVQRDDQQSYVTTLEAKTQNGVLRAPVDAQTPGRAGNTDDGVALRLLSPISDLPSTGYADSIEGGTDVEDIEDWRARIMARWYYTPQGGADQDYVIWATSVAGISRAWTYRHYSGIGTVGVMVATRDGDSPIPDNTLVDAVRAYILPLAPVAGAGLSVFKPTAKTLDMTLALAKDTAPIRQAVEKELKSFLLRAGQPEATLYFSGFSEAISLATGDVAHRIEVPANDIKLTKYELPVLGKITWATYTKE